MHRRTTQLMQLTVYLQALRAFRYDGYFNVILKVTSLLCMTLKLRVINNNNPTSLLFISHLELFIYHEVLKLWDILPQNNHFISRYTQFRKWNSSWKLVDNFITSMWSWRQNTWKIQQLTEQYLHTDVGISILVIKCQIISIVWFNLSDYKTTDYEI